MDENTNTDDQGRSFFCAKCSGVASSGVPRRRLQRELQRQHAQSGIATVARPPRQPLAHGRSSEPPDSQGAGGFRGHPEGLDAGDCGRAPPDVAAFVILGAWCRQGGPRQPRRRQRLRGSLGRHGLGHRRGRVAVGVARRHGRIGKLQGSPQVQEFRAEPERQGWSADAQGRVAGPGGRHPSTGSPIHVAPIHVAEVCGREGV